MANQVFNISRGRIGYYMADALGLAGANSRLVIVVLQVNEADDTLRDYDTLAAILGGSNTEAASTNYARKQVAAAGVTVTINDGANTAQAEVDADQTWTAVDQAASEAWTKLLTAYDNDNTAGTDANIVPMTHHDFAVTPNGGDITADFAPQFWTSS